MIRAASTKKHKSAGSSHPSPFGPPPLLDCEDAAAYHELEKKIYDAINPQDTIEELWARDVADLFWESLRLRRLKVKLIGGSKRDGLNRLYFRLTGRWISPLILEGWVNRDDEARAEVLAFLDEVGLDEEAITAQSIRDEIKTLESVERLIMQRDACRNAALRELERRRDTRARRLREIAHDLDHAETAALGPPQMKAAE